MQAITGFFTAFKIRFVLHFISLIILSKGHLITISQKPGYVARMFSLTYMPEFLEAFCSKFSSLFSSQVLRAELKYFKIRHVSDFFNRYFDFQL